jgi:hypothetical protein
LAGDWSTNWGTFDEVNGIISVGTINDAHQKDSWSVTI